MKDSKNLVQTDGIDLVTFGQRLRHLRRMRGLTLTELHLIEESLAKSLIAIFHTRIKYPDARPRAQAS